MFVYTNIIAKCISFVKYHVIMNVETHKGFVMTKELSDWLLKELRRRNQSARDASIGADIYAGGISAYLGSKNPSPSTCEKLADYFGVPRDMVLALAGHLKANQLPDEVFVRRIAAYADGLSDQDKQRILDIVRSFRGDLVKKK